MVDILFWVQLDRGVNVILGFSPTFRSIVLLNSISLFLSREFNQLVNQKSALVFLYIRTYKHAKPEYRENGKISVNPFCSCSIPMSPQKNSPGPRDLTHWNGPDKPNTKYNSENTSRDSGSGPGSGKKGNIKALSCKNSSRRNLRNKKINKPLGLNQIPGTKPQREREKENGQSSRRE
jgi:hypothetical protein